LRRTLVRCKRAAEMTKQIIRGRVRVSKCILASESLDSRVSAMMIVRDDSA